MSEFRFAPTEFARAVENAAKVHQRIREPEPAEREAWIEKFVRTLAAAPLAGCARLGTGMRVWQRVALVEYAPTVPIESGLLPKIRNVVAGRPDPRVFAAIYATLGHHYDKPEILKLADFVARNEQWNAVGIAMQPDLRHALAVTGDLRQLISSAYRNAGIRWERFVQRLQPLSPLTLPQDWDSLPLGRACLRNELISGNGGLFQLESAADLNDWSHRLLNASEYKRFVATYLTQTPFEKWLGDLLTRIIQRLGDPRSQPQNWDHVTQSVRERVVEWINTRKLEAFFLRGGGDRERYEFWRQFARYMGPRSEGRIAEGQGFFEFPGFGVIEFMETGNAAYIYPLDVYEQFRARTQVPNGALKNRRLLLRDRQGAEFRIHHSRGWSREWQGIIETLIREGSRTGG